MWLVREKERDEELRRRDGIVVTDEQFDDEEIEDHKVSIWKRLYYNKIFRGFILILAVALILPVFILLFLDVTNPEFDENHTCTFNEGFRVSCGVQNTTFEQCSKRKCCTNETDGSCFHTIPSYYLYKSEETTGNIIQSKPLMDRTPFNKTNKNVYLTYKEVSNTQVWISLTTDIPKKTNIPVESVSNSEYNLNVFRDPMAIEVNRTGGKRILSTGHGPTIVSEKYWEWTVNLEAEELFGMDFIRVAENETITRVVYKNAENHTTVPKFMAYLDGQFHGLSVEHEGPLEVTILPSKLIVLRSLSGAHLSLVLCTGPGPADVIRQLRKDPKGPMPPYWTLGVHICRDGPISKIDKILKEHDDFFTKSKNIPYDSDCIHENLFSLSMKMDTQIEDAVAKIKNGNKKFMMSLAPQILVDEAEKSIYKEAQKLNILYTRKSKTFIGSYLKQKVAYPDYSSTKTLDWLKTIFTEKFSRIAPDGFVLRNSWTVNDGYEMNKDSNFQYLPQEILAAMSKTLPWDTTDSKSTPHLETHNSYSSHFTEAISSTTPAFLLSASDSQTASHIQNVDISWVNFKNMITKTLSHGLFGGPLISTPVCGSTSLYSKEVNLALCVRWYFAASTLPLFRISSEGIPRDPTNFTDVAHISNLLTNAIKIRYSLLPFYYTILSHDLPISRPMFFDFYLDETTFSLDEQYMVGDCLLVVQPSIFPVPILQVYLPVVDGGWYEFWGGMKIPQVGWVAVPVVESDLVAFVKAGSIIPVQKDTSLTAEQSRTQPFKLIIALNCTNEAPPCEASGSLYAENLNQGNSIYVQFTADQTSLRISNAEECTPTAPTDTRFALVDLQVYGGGSTRYCKVDKQLCVKADANVEVRYGGLCWE